MPTTKLLVTLEAEDQDELDNITHELTTLLGGQGKVEPYTEQAKAAGATHDAYGNPYNRNAVSAATHDAYGNPYTKEVVETPTHDAYGNLHRR